MIETADIDPSYPVIKHLYETRPNDWMGRFLLHYMWFYNIRDAIRAADETSDLIFWSRCAEDGAGTYVKRGGARRHFRADNAMGAINIMHSKRMTPWEIVTDLYHARYTDIFHHAIKNYAGTQMGPYYIWKLMDWFDICFGWPVSLTVGEAVKLLPDNPRKHIGTYFPGLSFGETLEKMQDFLGGVPHFVKPNAGCGIPEAETILCIFKGYYDTKSIKVGADILEYRHKLEDLPELRDKCPAPIPPGTYAIGEYIYVP